MTAKRRVMELKDAVGKARDGLALRWIDNGQSFFFSEHNGGFVADITRARVFATMRDAHEVRKNEKNEERELDVVAITVER